MLDTLEAADFSAAWSLLLSDYIFSPLITMISCLLSIFVVLGNLLVVTAIWHDSQLHTVTNYLIASLAAADCLVGALVMPFNIISEIILGSWTFGPNWCDLWHSFDVLASTASIMNLCAISLDRYLAITNPISYPTKMTPKRVAFLIVFIWTCSALISFPAIVWWRAVGPGPLQEISLRPPAARHRTQGAGALQEARFQTLAEAARQLPAPTTGAQAVPPPPLSSPSSPSSSDRVQLDWDGAEERVEYKCVFTDDTYYLLFSSFVSFYGPLCVMLYAYYCIYRAAVQQTRFLKYGSKQVMVGGKRPRYISELSTGTKTDKFSSSERDCDGISNNGSHDRQRLVLRVHRGGGAAVVSTGSSGATGSNLSNSTYKSASDTSNANNSPAQRRHLLASMGSIKLHPVTGSKNCDTSTRAPHSPGCRAAERQTERTAHEQQANSVAADGPHFSFSPAGNLQGGRGRTQQSRRDELRVKCQRFDSSSSSTCTGALESSPTAASAAAASLSLLKQSSTLSDSDQEAPAAPPLRLSAAPSHLDQRSILTSDASTDSRGSIVTVEPRHLVDELDMTNRAARKCDSSSSSSKSSSFIKSKSCRDMATKSAPAGETDELLAQTRDVLSRFRRTISLESTLEMKRRGVRATSDGPEAPSGTQTSAAPTGDGHGRQLAPAYHDSDRFIRGMVDLSSIHYIDCTNQTYGLARPMGPASRAPEKLAHGGATRVQANGGAKCELGKSLSEQEPAGPRAPTVQMLGAGHSSGAGSKAHASPNHAAPDQHKGQHQNGKKLTKLAKERKAAKTLGIVVGVFILCWLPFFVVNIIVATCGIQCIFKPHILISIVTWLGWLNSAMNPVIYACWSRDFRRAFRKTLCTWVEFVCYDGSSMARKLKLKKGSSYLNTQEAFLAKSGAGAGSGSGGFNGTGGAANSNSHRSAVSIEFEGVVGCAPANSRNPTSDV